MVTNHLVSIVFSQYPTNHSKATRPVQSAPRSAIPSRRARALREAELDDGLTGVSQLFERHADHTQMPLLVSENPGKG